VLGEVEDKVIGGEEGKELGEWGTNSQVGESRRETETEFEEEVSVGEDLNWFCCERKETPRHGKSHPEKQKFD